MNFAKRLMLFASLLLACTTRSWGQVAFNGSLTQNGYVGVDFVYQIQTTPNATISQPVLPSWLTFSSFNNQISGKPPATGTNIISLTATPLISGFSSTTNLTLVILPATPSPVITSSSSDTAIVGKPYQYQILVSNVSVTTFSAAPLPDWLTIDANGLLSGTPQVVSIVPTITLTAANATSIAGTKTLTLKILNASAAFTTNAVFSEDFETTFPAHWQVGDDKGTPAYWAAVSSGFAGITAANGGWMGYCAGVGYEGSDDNPTYVNRMAGYMQRTFDASGNNAMTLSFRSLIAGLETPFDFCRVRVSANGEGFADVWKVSRVDSDWTTETVPLNDYAGKTSVTVRFEFDSDKSRTRRGWFVDDIQLLTAPGDRFDYATLIDSGTNYSGTVEAKNAMDVTRVTLRQGYSYIITATQGTLRDPELWLFDSNHKQLAFNDDYKHQLAARINYACTNSGDYFVQVGGARHLFGSYTLLVTEQPAYADIQALSVTMTLPEGDPRGQTPLSLEYTLKNNGPMSLDNGVSYSYRVDVYLSTLNIKDTGERIGSESIQLALASGASFTTNVDATLLSSFTIPSDLATGRYYVWLHVVPRSGSPMDPKSANNWVDTNQVGTATVTLPRPDVIISGIVTTSNGLTNLPDVTLSLLPQDGSSTNTMLTATNGSYSFSVSNGWSGSITPFFTNDLGGTFTPAFRTYTLVTSNLPAQNFAWAPATTPAPTVMRSAGEGMGIVGVPSPSKLPANDLPPPAVKAPQQLVHTTGQVHWSGADALQVQQSPEILTIALVNGVVKVEPVVPVLAPGDITTALIFADGLAGKLGTANSDLIVIRNVNGTPMVDASLTGTSVFDTVLFLTPGNHAVLSWDLMLVQP